MFYSIECKQEVFIYPDVPVSQPTLIACCQESMYYCRHVLFLHHCEKLLKARCTFVRNMTNSAFRSTSFLSLCAGLKKEKMALFSIAHRPRSHLPLFLCSETKQEPLRPFYLFTVWQLKIDEKNPGESGSPPLSLSQKQNRAMKGQSLHNRCSIKDRTLMKRRPTEEAYRTPRASYSI